MAKIISIGMMLVMLGAFALYIKSIGQNNLSPIDAPRSAS